LSVKPGAESVEIIREVAAQAEHILATECQLAQTVIFSSRQSDGKARNAMSSLQDRLDEFKKVLESGAPPYNVPREAIEKMHRATAELKASGIEDRALKVGDRAPSFTLFNQDHVQVASTDLPREGPLVISFFRGHW
jgi:hypothetical protein